MQEYQREKLKKEWEAKIQRGEIIKEQRKSEQ